MNLPSCYPKGISVSSLVDNQAFVQQRALNNTFEYALKNPKFTFVDRVEWCC